jgi:hypothetical protein
MDQHIISHLSRTFWVEKLKELACKAHFNGRAKFGKLRSRTSQSHFESLNDIFMGYSV